VAVYDDEVLGRYGTAGSELTTGIDADDTALTVVTTTGPVWTSDPADLPFDVKAGGEVMTVTDVDPALLDTFARTVASGWGTADTGQAWTTTGGAAADYAVGSGFGSVTNPATGIAHTPNTAAPSADVDLYVDVATSALATGASLFGGPVARWTGNTTGWYQARIEFTTAAAIVLSLRKRLPGGETQLADYTTGLTHVAGTFYRTRLQVIGSTLRAKVWPVGQPEPGWQLAATDTDLTAAGAIGTRSFSNAGNTNVNPQLRYDNLTLANPQTLTVTRSVNGVVKPHAAGTDVRLAQPAVYAL
jgi:hypothetical protein